MPALNPQRASTAVIAGVVPDGTQVVLTDDEDLKFGASADAHMTYDITDANAHLLMLQLPEGGAGSVSVLAAGCDSSTPALSSSILSSFHLPKMSSLE